MGFTYAPRGVAQAKSPGKEQGADVVVTGKGARKCGLPGCVRASVLAVARHAHRIAPVIGPATPYCPAGRALIANGLPIRHRSYEANS